MGEKIRDAQTILLCKINAYQVRKKKNAEYSEQYQKIYAGPDESTSRKFVTYGNFDAVSIYKTGKDDNWLKAAERDRRDVIGQTSQEICYHPIHVVSHSADPSFWHDTAAFPACLITLVYGVRNETETETEPELPCEIFISDYLKNRSPKIDDNKVKYAVYRAINICDTVIIWMTKDIDYALQLSTALARSGKARKTYSLLGLEMCDLNNPDASGQHLKDNLCEGEFCVKIQGSVRDYALAKEIFLSDSSKIKQWISDQSNSAEPMCVFGKEDFDIRIKKLTRDQLIDLVINMMKASREISQACWDNHTECISSKISDSWENVEQPFFKHELDACLTDYKKYYEVLKQDPIAYPWAPAYLELLGTHVNIDHHPVLHAPASLFTRFAKIANEYFRRGTNPNDELYQQFNAVLIKSRERILWVIRKWSHLTDQLTRTDDLVFHGIGSIPAIYETLPEAILEFYHVFLKEVVDTIAEADRELRNPGWVYEYDFLLIPEQNQRPRISKMFILDDYHNYLLEHCTEYKCNNDGVESCASCSDKLCQRKYSWPEKQVYLAEFQSSLLYDPPGFLFPMVHECFHFCGDTFRLREDRMGYFADVLATEILYELGLDKSWYQDLGDKLAKELEIAKPVGLNLSRTANRFYEKLKELFKYKTLNDIRKDMPNAAYLWGDEMRTRWCNLRIDWRGDESTDHWWVVLDKWKEYFSECFADLMALLLLEFPTQEYLRMVNDEWKSAGKTMQDADDSVGRKFVQRIVLVLAAYHLEENTAYTEETIEKEELCRTLKAWKRGDFVGNNQKAILEVLKALFLKEAPSFTEEGFDPPAKLRPVLDYLFAVKKEFRNRLGSDIQNPESSLGRLRTRYKMFFQEDGIFTEEFNSFMSEHRPPVAR